MAQSWTVKPRRKTRVYRMLRISFKNPLSLRAGVDQLPSHCRADREGSEGGLVSEINAPKITLELLSQRGFYDMPLAVSSSANETGAASFQALLHRRSHTIKEISGSDLTVLGPAIAESCADPWPHGGQLPARLPRPRHTEVAVSRTQVAAGHHGQDGTILGAMTHIFGT